MQNQELLDFFAEPLKNIEVAQKIRFSKENGFDFSDFALSNVDEVPKGSLEQELKRKSCEAREDEFSEQNCDVEEEVVACGNEKKRKKFSVKILQNSTKYRHIPIPRGK